MTFHLRTVLPLIATLSVAPLGCEEPATTAELEDDPEPAADLRSPPATLDDEHIASAVEAELWLDPAIDPDAIEVRVREGVTVLQGQVDHLTAQRRAVERAESVRGVRAVVNDVEVAAPEVEDAELDEAVSRALFLHPTTESYEVDVQALNGTITLTGDVDSWSERLLAEHVAGGVGGVRAIENELEVDFPNDRPDVEIQRDIESRLAFDVRIDAGLIHVTVEDGQVRLTGAVGSAAERSLAIRDAWVLGARHVDAGELEVDPILRDRMRRRDGPPVQAERVEQAIRDAWRYDPRVAAFEPSVHFSGGRAVIRGVVASAAAKRAAAEDARNTLGVWNVVNRLEVEPGQPLDDAELAARIHAAIELSPYLDAREIQVTTRDGRAHLTGTVDSAFERREATQVARATNGVRRVDDDIRVDDASPYPIPDWALEREIRDRLFWTPMVDAERVEVEVRDGVATLRGEVATWGAYRAAVDRAYEAGADTVLAPMSVASAAR